MGSVKQAVLEEAQRNSERNRYYHDRQKLIVLIRRYAEAPSFVAKLKDELKALEESWKASKPPRKRRKT